MSLPLESLLLRPNPVGVSAKPPCPERRVARVGIFDGNKKGGRRKAASLVPSAMVSDDPELRAALWAACIRYQEAQRPDPLFIDPFAGSFIANGASQSIMDETTLMAPYSPSRCHYRLATKFIDDKLLELTSNTHELRQVVLLTDGMDTRPFRLCWSRSLMIYDISPANVYNIASKKLKDSELKILRKCTLIHIPLEFSNLKEMLLQKGFNVNRPSIWVIQGPMLTSLKSVHDVLFLVSSFAIKGCYFFGVLPSQLIGSERGNTALVEKWMSKLFASHGLRVESISYNEVARNARVALPSGDPETALFIAEQLHLSDAQMEKWRAEFQRLEGDGDEDGFDEL